MTFGIDIATPQRDIDLVRARTEGAEFVVVKMGGLNVTPQYVAPNYHAQVDRAVAAGLPKGHYYLIGKGQTPEQQAEFFVANLYKFDPERDVLALDNEALDANGTRWGDAEAARFARRVLELVPIPVSRFWHYAGATDYRASTWPELAALGVRFWWAAYGNYPTGHTPDHEPDLRGSIPRWDIHQYSSRVTVAGYSLDGNYSPFPADVLFGGAPMTLEDKARAFARLYPTPASHPSGGDGSWDQDCGRVMFRFGSFVGWSVIPQRDVSSAYRVAMGSGPLRTGRAPVGAWHFWDIGGEANGHVAQEMDGNGLVFMGSAKVWEDLGVDIGFSSVSEYGRLTPTARYMGWATNYAGGTINAASTAGGGTTPIEEDDMFSDEDRALLKQAAANAASAKAGIWNGGSTSIDGAVQKFNYGVLPVVVHNQTLIAQQAARVAALQSAIEQAGTGGGTVDMVAVEAAAKAGAEAALSGLVLKADPTV